MTLCSWCNDPATHLGVEPACDADVHRRWRDDQKPVGFLRVPMSAPTVHFQAGLVIFGGLMVSAWILIHLARWILP